MLSEERAGGVTDFWTVTDIDISVIVPCFNGAKYLPNLTDCLRRVIAPNIEVIFVDDGSTDGSAELFCNLLPSALCLKQKNCGLGATRNRAVEVARGEFLQLLDADDTIEPGKFETQLSFARANSLDIVYSDWRMVIVDERGETPQQWIDAHTPIEPVEALLGGWWYPPHAALIRAAAFRAVGGCDASLGNTCEDFDLCVRLGIAGFRFGYGGGRFANYHRDTQVRSMSRKNAREFFDGEAKIILKAIHLLETQKAAGPGRRRAAARRLHTVARNAYSIDRTWYQDLRRQVINLDPQFRPAGSMAYRLACRWFGMEAAERLALWKRSAGKGKLFQQCS